MGNRPDRNRPEGGCQLGGPRPPLSASPAARSQNAATCGAAPAPREPPANNASKPPASAAPPNAPRWACRNAADPRRIVGQITALTDLPTAAGLPLSQLHAALTHDDPAALIRPSTPRAHLTPAHPGLAAQLDALTDSARQPAVPGGLDSDS